MIEGMIVSGFVVRANDGSFSYGLFNSVVSAMAWQEKMTVPTTVEAIYTPVFNRG